VDEAALAEAQWSAIMAELEARLVACRHVQHRRHGATARQISQMHRQQSTASVEKLVGKPCRPAPGARRCVLRAGLPEI
jgi:hypothetical protein